MTGSSGLYDYQAPRDDSYNLFMRQLQQQQGIAGMNNATAQQRNVLDAQTAQAVATTGANAGIRQAQEQAGASRYGADAQAASNRYTTDVGAQTTQRGQDLTLQAAQLPWAYKRQVLGQFGPALQSALSGLGGPPASNGFNTSVWGGGPVPPPQPAINLGPTAVPNPGDALAGQMQVARGQVDQAAGDQKRRTSEGLAARGFAPNSPLALALRSGIDTGARVANTEADAATRAEAAKLNLTAAQTNAQQQQVAAQLAQQQWTDYQTAQNNQQRIGLGVFQTQSQNQAAILTALSSLLG